MAAHSSIFHPPCIASGTDDPGVFGQTGAGRSFVHWIVVAISVNEHHDRWLPRFIAQQAHSFETAPARYQHDRSRRNTSPRQWLDYVGHALNAWRRARRHPRAPVGLITTFPQLAVAAGLLNRLTGGRMTIVAWYFNIGRPFEGWRRRLAGFALRGVGRIVVATTIEGDAYARHYGIPRERLVFAPYAADPTRRTLAEDRAAPFIVAMGTANRDYATLIAAVAPLGLRVVIVSGPHALDGLTLPSMVEARTNLTLTQCRELLQQARLVVVPMLDCGTGSGQVTLVEAMMFGRCVIATDVNGAADYIEDGVTGFLAPVGDAAALRVGIDRLWRDDRLRSRVGAAAAAAAESTFSQRAVAARMADICAAAAGTIAEPVGERSATALLVGPEVMKGAPAPLQTSPLRRLGRRG